MDEHTVTPSGRCHNLCSKTPKPVRMYTRPCPHCEGTGIELGQPCPECHRTKVLISYLCGACAHELGYTTKETK